MNKKIFLWILTLVLLCSFVSAGRVVNYTFSDTSWQDNFTYTAGDWTTSGGVLNLDDGANGRLVYDTTEGINTNVQVCYRISHNNAGTPECSGASRIALGGLYESSTTTANMFTATGEMWATLTDACVGNMYRHFLVSSQSYAGAGNDGWNVICDTWSNATGTDRLQTSINGVEVLNNTISSIYGGYYSGSWQYGGTQATRTSGFKWGVLGNSASYTDTQIDWISFDYLDETPEPTTGNFTITSNIDNFSATLGEEISVGVSAEYVCGAFTCFNYTTPIDYYVNTEVQLGDNRYDFDSEECTTGDLIEITKDTDLSANVYYYCNATLIQSIPSFANRTIGDLYLDRAFQSTAGTIVTNVLSNDTSLYNVTLFADEYYSVDYVDYNVSVDLNYNFPFFEVSAVDNGTQLNITNFDVLVDGNWTYNVTNGLVPIYINQSTVNISVFSDGYLTYSDTAHNTSNNLAAQMYDYSVNISFYDSNTSLAYNNSNITIFYPSGYSEVKTTDGNGTIFFDAFVNGLNEVGNYNFQVNSKTGYITPTNISATINQSNLPYNNTYGVDRAFFNITIRDVQTGQLLTQNATVTIGGVGQYTTNTGNLIIRDSSIAAGSYVITTFVAGYDLNTRNVDYTAQEEERLTISMVNETGENIGDWIVTVLDPFYNEFLGADTRLLEYDPATDVYNEIDSCITNSNGRCVYSIEIGIKKYIVTASGDIDGLEYLAQSSQTGEVIYFDQDTVNLFLNLKPDFYVSPSLNLDIWYYNDTLVNATGGEENANLSYLSAQFLDSEGNSHEVCIDYYYVDGLNKRNATTVCATGSSGIVKVMGGYILDRSLTWIAEITLVQAGGDKEVVYSFTYQKEDGLEFQLGIYSKFLIILIFIVMLVISLWLKNILIFGVGAIAAQPFVIGMLPSIWDWKIASIIIFLGLILIYLTRKTESLQSV